MGTPMKNRIRKTLALVLGIMALACLCLFAAKTWIMTAISGFAFLASTALSLIIWHMLELNPADSHTWHTVITQYLIFTLMSRNGHRIHRCFIRKCKSTSETQAEVLNSILKTNQSTVYGIKYGFSKITNATEFISSHPLTRYNHYLSYIHDIAQGKQNILTKDKVVYLATSSGTTGAAKLIPVTQMMKGPTARYVGSLMYYMMKRKGRLDLGRVFVLSYKSLVTQVPSGLKKGPITAHMFRYLPFAISPEEAFEIPNEQEAIHVHAVFALKEQKICHIEALMSTLVYSFWRYIEHNWQLLCDDIERASLPKNIHADRDILVSLKAKLSPDAHRADSLRQEFSKGFRGIARRVWPNIRFVRMLATGGFAHYAEVLAQYYMTDVKQLSLLHVASEGFIGINISENLDDFTYTAMIEYAFQEYIPLECVEEEQPVTVMAGQVERNKLYEVVITTPAGLYRYRTGDVVKITGFLYQCPVYEFQYRLGQLLNLNWEKLPESVIYDSVLGTVRKMSNVILVDYTATEDIHLDGLRHNGHSKNADLKHYVLFIEIERLDQDFILNDVDKLKFDETLRQNFHLYNTMRENCSIGPMEVIQVTKGSFQRLKEHIIEHTQSQQYKLARVMRHRLHLKYLLSQNI